MKFNSQICTTEDQSERLLVLGLRKETADFPVWGTEKLLYMGWSLHRLIEMMPRTIKANDDLFFLLVSKEDVFYDNTEGTAYSSFINRNGLYYNVILCIEWLIKEGYFNKEYLEE